MSIREARKSAIVTVSPGRAVRRARNRAKSAPADDSLELAAITGIQLGELSLETRDAIGLLVSEIDTLRGEVEAQRSRIAQLEHLADQDTLTSVANRRAFVRELSRAVSYNVRYVATSTVVYFDLNGLKSINDTYGHAAGDAALVMVANTLRVNVRGSDLVGRLGGDEFGVLLSRVAGQAARQKALSLVKTVESEPLRWDEARIPLRLACGIHTIGQGESAADALAAADREMYVQKRARA